MLLPGSGGREERSSCDEQKCPEIEFASRLVSQERMRDAAQHPDDFANAYEAAFARLQIRVEHACMGEPPSAWPAQVAAAIRAALAFAGAHPELAYLLTSGALAQGKAGFARYDRMLDHFAQRLRPGRAKRPEGEFLPAITEKAMIGGLAMLVAQRVDTGRASELPGCAPEAIQFVLTPYVGAEQARRWGARHSAI